MDDLKVVFYIVVAIIWVVYNNYKKISQASKKRDISKPAGEIIPENWPKVELPRSKRSPRNLQSPAKQVIPSERKSLVKQTLKVREPLKREPVSERSRKSEKYESIIEGGMTKPSKVVHFEEAQKGTDEPNLVVEQIRNTDFRRAILLSEILNRPYN